MNSQQALVHCELCGWLVPPPLSTHLCDAPRQLERVPDVESEVGGSRPAGPALDGRGPHPSPPAPAVQPFTPEPIAQEA